MKHLNLLICLWTMWTLTIFGAGGQTPREETPRGWATVTGRVLDSDEKPVAGAEISIFPLDTAASGAAPKRPMTDDKGRYRLVSPAYEGRTRLCAVKESAGYPDTQVLLFASGTETKANMPEVHLTPNGYLENVEIRLGAPDGTIEGFIVDAKTRVRIQKARINLHRVDLEAAKYSTSLYPDGHFLFAIPPAPIEVTIEAPGYLSWKYEDSRSRQGILLVNAPEHRVLTIELTPK